MAKAPETNTNGQGTETAEEGAPIQHTGLSLLANSVYGDQFKGEVKDSPSDEDDKGGTVVADPPEDVDADDMGETPPDEEAETESEEAEEAGEVEKGDEEEGEPITSLDELAEHYQLDSEFVNGLEVPVKIDGKSATVPLKELIANHQIGEAAENRLTQAKERAQTLNQEHALRDEQLQTQLAIAAELIQKAEDMIDTDSSAINWAQLREDDPAEYAAKSKDLEDRRKELNLFKEDAASKLKETVEKEQEAIGQRRIATMQTEYELLLKAIPEWQEEKVRIEETARISKHLLSQGYSQEQVDAAIDHKDINQARKAMLWDELQAKVPAAKKKIAKVPRVMRPGSPKSKSQTSQESLQRIRAQARKSGKLDDVFEVLKAGRKG